MTQVANVFFGGIAILFFAVVVLQLSYGNIGEALGAAMIAAFVVSKIRN